MLYLFYGTDADRVRAKVGEVIEKLKTKRPDASVFSFNPESWSAGQFEEMIGAQTLFAGKSIILGRELLGFSLAAEFILKHVDEIQESENIFFLQEGELKKDIVSKIEKKAEKVQEIGVKAKAGKPRDAYNIYAFSDALGDRDRKGLWIEYQRALHAGLVPEELFWKCTWQIKNMLLATRGSRAGTPESLNMNPFVFKKALSAARNYTEEELVSLHRDFVKIYHDARRGRGELAVGLEQKILAL